MRSFIATLFAIGAFAIKLKDTNGGGPMTNQGGSTTQRGNADTN